MKKEKKLNGVYFAKFIIVLQSYNVYLLFNIE